MIENINSVGWAGEPILVPIISREADNSTHY